MGKSFTHTKVLFWVFLWVLQILLIGVVVPGDWLEKQVEEERRMTFTWLGRETVEDMIEKTDENFESWFEQTGVVSASFALIPTREQRENSTGMQNMGSELWPYIEGRIRIMWVTVYQALQRLSMIAMWLPYLLPALLPAVVHGLCAREIKKVSYGYASPVVYHSAGHVIALLVVAPLFYVTAPFGIHPAAILFWGIALSFALLAMIANVQKLI